MWAGLLVIFFAFAIHTGALAEAVNGEVPLHKIPADSRVVLARGFKVSVKNREQLSKKIFIQFGAVVEGEDLDWNKPFCGLSFSMGFVNSAIRFQPVLKTYDLILEAGSYDLSDKSISEGGADVPGRWSQLKAPSALTRLNIGTPPSDIAVECVKAVGSKALITLDDWNGVFHKAFAIASIYEKAQGEAERACSIKDYLELGAPLSNSAQKILNKLMAELGRVDPSEQDKTISSVGEGPGIEILKAIIVKDPRELSKTEAIRQLGWLAMGARSGPLARKALFEIDTKTLSPNAYGVWVVMVGRAAGEVRVTRAADFIDKTEDAIYDALDSHIPSDQKAGAEALVNLFRNRPASDYQRELVSYFAGQGSGEVQGELAWGMYSIVSRTYGRKIPGQERTWMIKTFTQLAQSSDTRAQFWAKNALEKMKK